MSCLYVLFVFLLLRRTYHAIAVNMVLAADWRMIDAEVVMSHPGSRSQRRAMRQRALDKAKRSRFWDWWAERVNDHRAQARRLGMLATTPKSCSCFMCGNPRRYGGDDPLTLAERRMDDVQHDGLQEWLEDTTS